ncbi:MAG: ABC transporter [Anaerolineaceae bacterium]|nr:ABC transporter [Anaerolineaceae bacterium]
MTATPTTLTPTPEQATLQTALANRSRPSRPNPLDASLTLAWRAILKIKHVPMQLFDVTMFPIMMTLMFTFLFGGALAGSVGEYLQFLLPGILVMTLVMISMYTAVALNTDISKGIFDRFRSLPFWRPAVLVGALLGDSVRYTLASLVVIVLGLILGFRPGAGIVGVVLSLLLILTFAFSLSWIWTTLGLLMKTPESVMGVSAMATFPLTFASNIFVDPATMPSWLQVFVNINPVSHTATAVRGLMHGTATADQIGWVLLACAALIGIFGPLTMYLYRNKNAR